MIERTIKETFTVKAAIEGAGVHLHRGFSNPELPKFDPFLLFDDFSAENPADYLPGFPMHPHRGIETVTYIISGEVRHRDSTGTAGSIGAGDVQWMTAGSGILHEEMPKGERGIKGFQLWVNLPSEAKMMNPRYQEVKSKDIPEMSYGKDAHIRLIAGTIGKTEAPIRDIIAEPTYLDVSLLAGGQIELPVHDGHNAFVYVFEGALEIGSTVLRAGQIGLLTRTGLHLKIRSHGQDSRFLLASGAPLNEPIAWYGPIVMNTKSELVQAVEDLQTGKFIRA